MTRAGVRHYYVDEAGDGTLFAARGQILVGSEGCSRHFILGYVDIVDPDRVSAELTALRQALIADPFFRGVPSMQVDARKTALAFHAKDDIPEVRREVMALLLRQDFRFLAEVTDKMQVLQYVQKRSTHDPLYRYHPNELYDHLVRRLFKNALHKADTYQIYFAKRGKADRTAALRSALEDARMRFRKQWNIASDAVISIHGANPSQCPGLQVADYMLWALQRYFERNEDRYIQYLWPKCSLIHDIDDVRERAYGRYYDRKHPLAGPRE